jgi:PAS domain S-box-containing protein
MKKNGEEAMKKLSRYSWLFPCCFLIFLSIVLTVKFVFIFFFSTAYEPGFIFELTPLYLLSGLSKVQLLSLSLLVMVLDMYLHLRSSKRNLLLSFLPTSVMLSSVGFTIMFSPMDVSYVFHYTLFGCLLLVVLIDYQSILKGTEIPTMLRKKEPAMMKISQKEPVPMRMRSLFVKHTRTNQPPPVPPLATANSLEYKEATETILQKMQMMLDELERKTVRIERLENDFEERRKNLISQEKTIADHVISYLESKEKMNLDEENLVRNIPSDDKVFMKEKIVDHLIVDEKRDIVAVVQRGIFKQVSNTFADFLGYERNELLQKSFFVFIAPHGFEDTRKYYLNRLKGVTSNSFRTILLTREHSEVMVEITVTPTIYMGDDAEFLSVKEVKNIPQNT